MGGRGSGSGLMRRGGNVGFQYVNGQPISLQYHQRAEENFRQTYGANIPQVIQEKVSDALKEAFKVNGFYMQIKAEFIENVVDEHFKNQFEVGGRSGGASFDARDMSPRNDRVAAAMQLFDVDYKTMGKKDYEKYGYLNSMDFDTATNNLNWYGDTLVRFKKENVWDRTTYTMTDSLGLETVAGRVNNPSIAGFSKWRIDSGVLTESSINDALASVRDPKEFANRLYGRSPYLELQYHGELSIRDVEEITYGVRNRSGQVSMPTLSVQKRIAKLGIKQYVYDPSTGKRKEIKP